MEFLQSHNEFLSATQNIFTNSSSAPICIELQLPTDVIHRSACIRTLGHLSQHWSRWRHLLQSISQLIGTKRLAFMLCPEIYEQLKARLGAYVCVRVRAWMHTLAAYAHLTDGKRSGWCAYWRLTSSSLSSTPCVPVSPPSIHLSLNPSPSFKSLLGNPIPFISTKRLAF